MTDTKYSLKELIYYFLRLGTTGFGGPVALVGYMHKDLVEKRSWITEEEYREGLALAQLAPGPLAAQLAIYLGYVHYRIAGATLCGLAFVLPSFVMVVLLGMAWIPMMGRVSDTLYQYLQSVQSYLAPPIAAVFLLGVFFKRINATGAYTAMVVGFITGLLKLTLEMFKDNFSGIVYQFATINFLYFCIYLFLFSIAVMVIVSMLTPKPSEEHIRGLTFATTVAEDRAASRASWNKWDVILSLIVLAIVVSIFIYFSPLGVAS